MRDSVQLSEDKHAAMRALTVSLDMIDSVASALEAVGLTKLSWDLDKATCMMSSALDDLHKIDGEEVSNMVSQSFQSSTHILKATLAGIELARQNDEQDNS